MKTATSGFISAISDGCPYHTVKFYYNGTELDITPKTFNYYGLMIGGENINIGETCASHVEFEIYNPTVTLENKEIQVKCGIEVNGSIEYVSIGYFTVTKPSIESEVYKYIAYDRMIGLERLYVSSLTNPTTSTVMNEIATQLGYTFASTITEISLDINKIKGYTYREMLGFISALCGANCIFNGEGAIEFKWFVQPTSDLASIGTDRLYENGLELNSDEDITVGYIKCATGETNENTTTDENGEENTETVDVVLSVGSGSFGINISNPLMTQTVLENIYNTYFSNFTFRPCKVNLLGNILLECGDIVTVNNGTNTYTVPIMSIQHSIDGGVVTNIETIAQNETEQEISYTSPTVKLMDRVYYEILEANKAIINDLTANTVTTEYLKANYAQINLANIENGCITNAMIGTEAVDTSQIADGSITDAKIVTLTANKINAGTLSCDRLVINGSEQSLVYYLNNMGTLSYSEVDSINGGVLTERSITADKIVANAITANEIASRTITANKIVSGSITANEIAANTITSAEIATGSIKAVDIDVANLFAQDITATGTISGLTLKGTEMELGENITFLNNGVYCGKIDSYSGNGATGFELYAPDSMWISAVDVMSITCGFAFISSPTIKMQGSDNIRLISETINVEGTLDATGAITTSSSFGMTASYSSGTAPVYCKWKDSSNHDLLVRSTDGLTANLGWAGSSTYKTIVNLRGQSIMCNGATSWTSDENLKKDFNNFDDRYDILFDNLKPITYKYILGTSGRVHSGFKSQDVEKALEIAQLTTQEFGGVVIQPINCRETERDDNGNEVDIELSEKNYLLDKGINEQHNLAYMEFIALNTWQIQKLKIKVKEQQQEMDELKQTVQSLIEGVQK